MFGFEIITKLGIRKIVIIGDSRQVIENMRSGYTKGNIRCKRIYRRITFLSSKIKANFFHILWKNNGEVDLLANKGAILELGFVHGGFTC